MPGTFETVHQVRSNLEKQYSVLFGKTGVAQEAIVKTRTAIKECCPTRKNVQERNLIKQTKI